MLGLSCWNERINGESDARVKEEIMGRWIGSTVRAAATLLIRRKHSKVMNKSPWTLEASEKDGF